MISYVDGYVKTLAAAVPDEHVDRIARLRGTTVHVESMAARGAPFDELHAADALDWTRACVDASHIRAKKGGRGDRPVTGRPRKDGQ